MPPPVPVPVAELLDYCIEARSDMVDLLVDLARIETPSDRPETMAPMFSRLVGELESRVFRARRFSGTSSGGYLIARPPERPRGAPIQLLVGHVDTVWPVGSLRRQPVIVSDGAVRGPGTYDMKAGLVQILFAVGALRELGSELGVTPVVLLNSDEELGSRDSSSHIVRLSRIAARALVLEPALGPHGQLKTARKALGRFVVTIHGKAAHAGLEPDLGASAIVELSHVIQALHSLNDPQRDITVNVGTIEGGMRPNVVAPTSQAVADVRVLHPEDLGRVEAAIRGLSPVTPGTSLGVEGGFGRPPMERTPGNVALFARAQQLGRNIGLDLEEVTAGGGSDGNTTAQHTATLDGLGAVGEGAHAVNEQVSIDSLATRTALLAALIQEPASIGGGDAG